MIDQALVRFFRYLIDTDGKLPSEYSKKVYNSEVDTSFFKTFLPKQNVFAVSPFSLLWDICREFYIQHRSPISDTTLSMQVDNKKYTPEQVRDLDALLVDIRKYNAEPGQFDALKEEIRNDYVRNQETSIYQRGMELSKDDPISSVKYVQKGLSSLLSKTEINEDADDKCMYLWQLMEVTLKEFREHGSVMPNAISYGFSDFDQALGGLYPGELVVVCGPPGTGKSFWCSEIGYFNALEKGKRVVMANKEMLYQQVVNRFLSRQTRIPSKKLRAGISDEDREIVITAMEDFIAAKNTNLFFMPPSKAFSCESIKHYIEETMGDTNPELIIVDYLNELATNSGREEAHNKIGTITQELKQLAVYFKCPVITPTQPNSAGIETQNPTMKDMGYKIISQKADTIFFMYEDQDCKYVPPMNELGIGVPGQIFVKTLKARNDGKPPHPFKLEVEFATTSVTQSKQAQSAIARMVDDYEE